MEHKNKKHDLCIWLLCTETQNKQAVSENLHLYTTKLQQQIANQIIFSINEDCG